MQLQIYRMRRDNLKACVFMRVVYVYVLVRVYVCVREREREKEREILCVLQNQVFLTRIGSDLYSECITQVSNDAQNQDRSQSYKNEPRKIVNTWP